MSDMTEPGTARHRPACNPMCDPDLGVHVLAASDTIEAAVVVNLPTDAEWAAFEADPIGVERDPQACIDAARVHQSLMDGGMTSDEALDHMTSHQEES